MSTWHSTRLDASGEASAKALTVHCFAGFPTCSLESYTEYCPISIVLVDIPLGESHPLKQVGIPVGARGMDSIVNSIAVHPVPSVDADIAGRAMVCPVNVVDMQTRAANLDTHLAAAAGRRFRREGSLSHSAGAAGGCRCPHDQQGSNQGKDGGALHGHPPLSKPPKLYTTAIETGKSWCLSSNRLHYRIKPISDAGLGPAEPLTAEERRYPNSTWVQRSWGGKPINGYVRTRAGLRDGGDPSSV